MDRSVRAEPGRTLPRRWGSPHLSRAGIGYTVRRTALTAAAIAAFVAGTTAASAALTEQAYAGLFLSDSTPQLVVSVDPTGFAWRQGIRADQKVVAFDRADSPGGWRIQTVDPAGSHEAREAPWDQALRDSLPLALGGLAAGSLALVFLRTHRSWVLPAACIGLSCSSGPLYISGRPEPAVPILALAALVPALWFAFRVEALGIVKATFAIALVAAGVVWSIAYLGGWGGFAVLEQARRGVMAVGVGGVLFDRSLLPIISGAPRRMSRPRAIDLAAVAILAGLAVLLMLLGSIPPVLLATALVAIVLLFPAARGFTVRRIGGALVADLRQQAAADALEQERGRIARELHDAPLQQLVGIIRRLEVKPEAQAEVGDLTAVAEQLRIVATDLRPPVLDDLGLGAALEFLAEETTTANLPVSAHIEDEGRDAFGRRPPPEVELAVFRIAQEAVGNAIAHAEASTIDITSEISPSSVELVVSDDGSGIRPEDGRSAARRGRLGLASMRRRAQGIDAEFSIDGHPSGTTVRVAWRQ
jgi:signal transduction histidine kinase